MASLYDKKVVMICTAARGGMRSVVEGYQRDGVFQRWNVVLINSHVEGSLWVRATAGSSAIVRFTLMLLRGQVRLVHCHAAMRGSFWRKAIFSLMARIFGVPVLFHLHGSEMKTFVGSQTAFLQRLISWILAKQTKVVVLSQSWKQYVLSISPTANVEILVNYVKLPKSELRNGTRGEGTVNILFLGMIGSRKGVYELLPAFRQALIDVPNLILTIGGNGEVDRARAMAEDLEIADKVRFPGWVSGDDKLRLLAEAHIYTLPSHNEGLPVSLLEAMSWGLPVISTKVGGIPELVRDGTDGLLVEAGDQDALARALIDLGQDGARRDMMGMAARSNVERGFSAEVVIPRLDELYQSAIAESTLCSNCD